MRLNFTLCVIFCVLTISLNSQELVQYEAAVDENAFIQSVLDEFPGISTTNLSNFEIIATGGDEASVGTFSNAGLPIGFESGLVLTNSKVGDFIYGNTSTAAGTDLDLEGDNNLMMLNQVYSEPGTGELLSSFDASSLQFDFMASASTVRLDYVFASEEYCDYAAFKFTDKMGIFLSGPGIDGPFLLAGAPAINLAEFTDAAGDAHYISATTLNHLMNTNLYIDNNTVSAGLSANCEGLDTSNNPFVQNCEFDGWTVPLTASYDNLQLGETYTIQIVIDDGLDEIFGSAVFLKAGSFIVSDSPAPIADAGDDVALDCSTGSLLVGGPNTSDGPEYTYTWIDQFGAVISTEKNPVISQSGTYTLIVTNSVTGEQSEDSFMISENFQEPIVDVTSVGEFNCITDSIQISASTNIPMDQADIQWTTLSGLILSDPALPSIFAGEPGLYEVRVTDLRNGCFSTFSYFIDDMNNDILVIQENESISCEGIRVINPCREVLDNYTSLLCQGFWEEQPGITLGEFPVASVDLTGTYNFNVTDDNGCVTAKIIFDIEIVEPLTIDIDINANNQIEANVTGGVGPYTYSWNVGADSTVITNPINGTEYILTVTDANGCQMMETFLFQSNSVFAPTTNEIQVFPNPTDGLLTIQLDDRKPEEITQIQVFDVRGTLIAVEPVLLSNEQFRIDLSAKPKGAYILHLEIDQQTYYQKVIVQ